MSRITVQSLGKSYGGEAVFSDVAFEVTPGMRLALTGPNGCGKSTLLKVLAGRIEPDVGQVTLSKGAQVGYVAQEMKGTVLEEQLLSWVLSALPSWKEFWKAWEKAVADGDDARIAKLSHRQAEFESLYGYNPDHKARAILTGLGFDDDELLKQIGELSGGWRERAKLARVLLQGADVLLLDEPTNHLDLEAVEWLEDYLLNFRGTLAFVVHDRIFLNRVGTHVLFLGAGKPVLRKGSFDEFLIWDEENREQRRKEAAKLSARIDTEYKYINKFRVKARKAAQAQSKLKKVVKLEQELNQIKEAQAASHRGKSLNFRLPEPKRGDKVPVAAVDLEFHYEGGHSVWSKLNFQLFRGKKVAVVAPNGAGKSTLLKLITGGLAPSGGHVKIGSGTDVGYFSQHQHEILNLDNSVISEIRRLSDPGLTEQQVMSVLGLFLLGEPFFERKVKGLSGGEKSRLLLATLFLARANLLILDEPTNHLDIETREGLIRALHDYEGTLLFVAHDRYLLNEVAEEVWALDENGIVPYLGGFEEFHSKQKQEEACRTGLASCKPEEVLEKRKLSKEDKRRQAEERNRLYRQLKPLKKKYDKLETDLEKVLEDQARLEAKMNDPLTYERPEEALKINADYKDASEWAETLMEQMAVLEEQMEAITSLQEEEA
ncbi:MULTISPECIES: ABC-F family ATP-binding cassette domain-containing protein [unclassified Pseudodesulfovibrio]|uniref:ABC-F family ATP-binding cassette domain-containing protein n=1 Tax=unclassified Pseudodesulfovibrio TaxID=2661612 RepID=UPI000FEC0F09|nr:MULTISPECIES: ABC-F family ATP-binding cassette domain-containing protein [unclassified Pseudodesulfovibrio]MCJ2164079.1 ABC-F family ATP-binding cassette domain-containing protein [Pseudodesulfovibrio sp. S3-i]RWU05290.1 ABC transporter ATP-binding protein [Pseudodesulfovibrio sp. S3]